jgi:hypothetical protein
VGSEAQGAWVEAVDEDPSVRGIYAVEIRILAGGSPQLLGGEALWDPASRVWTSLTGGAESEEAWKVVRWRRGVRFRP